MNKSYLNKTEIIYDSIQYLYISIIFFDIIDIEIRRHFFIIHKYIWCIAFYFSISLDTKVPEDSNFFDFSYWFWLMIKLFFRLLYSITFAYYPMNVMWFFLMLSFIFY